MPARDPASRIKASLRAYQEARDPLDRLDLSRRIRESAEELEAAAIVDARGNGATWRDIGSLYGLTKQGAQQRFRTAEVAPAKVPRKKATRAAGPSR